MDLRSRATVALITLAIPILSVPPRQGPGNHRDHR